MVKLKYEILSTHNKII